MSSYSVFTADGLNTTANPIASVARGSAKIADNCVVREKDIWESRRGQALTTYKFGNVYDRANAIGFYNNFAILQTGDSGLDVDYYQNGFTRISNAAAPPAPDVMRTKFCVANECLFLTTSSGIGVVDDRDLSQGEDISNRSPRAAGLPKPFDVETQTTLVDVTDANWLPTANQIALRVCFGRKDPKGNVQLGPASEAAVLANTSGNDRSISVYIGLPSGMQTGDVYRIFLTDPSGSATIHPGDECFLTYEGPIAAANLSAGSITKQITVIESVPSDIPLYTNPNTGDGIEASKLPAPWAKDICLWQGALWAFGVKRKQTFRMTLLGTTLDASGTGCNGSNNGIVYINGKRYMFTDEVWAWNTITNGRYNTPIYYSVDEGPDAPQEKPDSASAIEATAKALVHAINVYDTTLRAYYLDSADGWPGEIIIEESGQGADAFEVYGSTYTEFGFSPQLPTIGEPNSVDTNVLVLPQPTTTSLKSVSDDAGNVAWFTPIDEPEAWPAKNFLPVGRRGSNFIRGVPLKDRVYCFMDDASVQVISGAGGIFRVDELDSTALVIGPDTVAVANNQIWALTRQGVCTIGEGGVGVVGLPIEADVRTLFGGALDTTKLISFGFGYESERSYIVWLPTRAGQTVAQQGFVYNYFTKTWTRWPVPRTCGAVSPPGSGFNTQMGTAAADALFMGDGRSNAVRIERKTLTQEDYADESFEVAVTDLSLTTLTVASTVGINVGDMVQQDGDIIRAVVTEVTDATHIQVHSVAGFSSPGTLTIYVAIQNDLQWQAATMEAPGIEKTLSGVTLHFLEAAFVKAEAFLTTEKSLAPARMQAMQKLGWGYEGWGEFPWGEQSGPMNFRMDAPMDKRSGAYFFPRFTIREAKSAWKCLGYTLEFDSISDRTRR